MVAGSHLLLQRHVKGSGNIIISHNPLNAKLKERTETDLTHQIKASVISSDSR